MYRIGNARDIHKLVPDRKLFIGTIEIPFDKGLLGHSDGDCLTHAIVNAIIGAMGLGDIGKFFPDNDPKYKDISSSYFLKEIKKELEKNHYEIVNIDSIVMLEKPILRPYIDSMVESIANILGIEKEKVNVKATRGEGLGFIGEGLGIEARAVCLLKKSGLIKIKNEKL